MSFVTIAGHDLIMPGARMNDSEPPEVVPANVITVIRVGHKNEPAVRASCLARFVSLVKRFGVRFCDCSTNLKGVNGTG